MMTPAIVGLLTLALTGQVAQPDPASLEGFTKLELYQSAVRFQAKAKDAEIRLGACESKLSVRTASVVSAIAMGYERPPEKEADGMSAGTFLGWIVAAGAIGLVVGAFVLGGRAQQPPAVVVTQ